MQKITVEQLIELLPKAFLPEKAKNVNTTVQVSASGEGGGDWIIRIQDGECKVEKGITENYDLYLAAKADDILKIFTGEMDGMQAFMQGKVQFKGNIGAAMRLTNYFSTDKEIFNHLK